MKSKFTSIISILAVSLYPVFFLFSRNITSVRVKDTLLSAGVLVLFSFLVLIVSFIAVQSLAKASLAACVSNLLFSYFKPLLDLLNRIIPIMRYWHLLILLILIIFDFALFLKRKVTADTAQKINLAFLVIFGGMSLINIGSKIPLLFKTIDRTDPVSASHKVGVNESPESTPGDLPNFYYFIFDEFAGYDNIQRYCNYDNQLFFDGLKELGFSVSLRSSNPTIDTYTEIPNLLQLRNMNSIELSALQKMENTLNPQLLVSLKILGYKINLIDSNPNFLDTNLADFKFISKQQSSYGTFTSLIIGKSALYPFYGKNDKDIEGKLILDKFEYAKNSPNLLKSDLFTIAYINFPHLPFVFTEDGELTADKRRLDVVDPTNYLGQYKYASKIILDLASALLQEDPEAIIVLQSDHGFRYPSLLRDWYGDDRYNLTEEYYYERNILNAVHLPNRKIDIEGLNGIDTLKLVLSTSYKISFQDNQP